MPRRPTVIALALALTLSAAGARATDDINEGELRFLTEPPAEPVHHHSKHVVISPESLKTGWIANRQCHYHLDQVSAMEVVFGAGRVRGLRITRADNIGRSWIEGDSVQLQDIGPDAVLCIMSENRALAFDPARGVYTLTSGPYMRRFLDGFFPIRVTLALDYPSQLLGLPEIAPPELRVKAVVLPGHLRLDTLFEGELTITLQFAINRDATPHFGG